MFFRSHFKVPGFTLLSLKAGRCSACWCAQLGARGGGWKDLGRAPAQPV